MAWTTPKTWADNELVTAALMNEQVRDNMAYLKIASDTAFNHFTCSSNTAYTTTTSGSFSDIDATNLAGSLTTTGGPVLIGVSGNWKVSGTGIDMCVDVMIDGSRIGHATYGSLLMQSSASNLYSPVSWSQIRALAAGSHTFKLQWRTSSGTLSIGPYGTHFYVVELL